MNQASTAQNRFGPPALCLVLAWAVFLFVRYFSSLGNVLKYLPGLFDLSAYPPASGSQIAEVWGGSLRILATASVIGAVTFSWGSRVRRLLSLDLPNRWLSISFDFGFGVVFLNLFWIGIGLARLWFAPVWAIFGVFLLATCTLDLVKTIRSRSAQSLNSLWPKEGATLFLFLAGVFYWVFSLFQNLAPETFYDSMVYHLAVPQFWLSQHGLADFSTNFFSNYPYGGECYFLNGLVFQGTETAKVLHALSFGVCALLAGGWAKDLAGKSAGWLALGLTLTLPLFALNTWATQVEGLLALGVLLFAYAFYQFTVTDRPRVWALAAGLLGGLALSTKYTALLGMASVFVILIFQKRDLFKRDRWASWGLVFLGGLLVLGPWIVKNMLYTGNPFFPYFMSLFQGRHLTAMGYKKLMTEQHSRVTTEWWTWLLLPWTLVMGNQDSYNFSGPVALAFLPFLFLFRLKHPALKFLVWAALLFFVAGLSVTHILKFMVPDFVLFYILLSAVLAGGDRPAWGRWAAWAAGLSAMLCFAYLSAISHFYYSCAGIWSGRQTRADYLSSQGKITPYYPLAQWLSANRPPQDRFLVVGDARGLYYSQSFLTNTVFDEQVLAKLAREEKDAEGIAHRLREMGVDDLVVNGAEGIRVSADYHHYDLTNGEWARLDDFLQRGTELTYSQNLQAVYRLLPALKEKPGTEITDLVLFFSKPASQFVLDIQKHQWTQAEEDIRQVVELYPFSTYWKNQKLNFDQALKGATHG